MNEKLLQRITDNKRQYWSNAQNVWRWYTYPPQLVAKLWRMRYVKYSVKLELKSIWSTYNPAIDLKSANLKRLSNWATGRTLWKYCQRKNSFVILNLLCWTFHRIQNFYQGMFMPLLRASGTSFKKIYDSLVLRNHWHKACLGWGKWLPYVFYTYGWLGTIVSGGPHWKFLRYDIKLWTCSFICVLKFQNFFLQLVSETAMFYFSIYTHIFHPSLKLSHSFLKLIMPSLQIFFVGHLHSGMKLPWWSIMKV